MPNSNKIKNQEKTKSLKLRIKEIDALYEIIKKDIEEGNFTTSLEQHFMELDIISEPNDHTSFDVDNNLINGFKMNELKYQQDLLLALDQTKIDLENGNYTIETAEQHIERLWPNKE